MVIQKQTVQNHSHAQVESSSISSWIARVRGKDADESEKAGSEKKN